MKLLKSTPFLTFLLSLFTLYGCGEIANDASTMSADNAYNSRITPGNDQNLSKEQRQRYHKDAEILAVRYINKKDSSQTKIPADLVQLFYNGLIHIANADHPEAQEATQEYPVHARNPGNPREILVFADSTSSWVDAWRSETTQTGNTEVDDLIDRFDLTLVNFSELEHTLPTVMATLRSSRVVNIFAVSRLFLELNDIKNAHPDYVTDGSDISVLFFDDFLRYTLVYRFGDCPSGCINEHTWKFNVYFDGSVEFIDEQGDALPK